MASYFAKNLYEILEIEYDADLKVLKSAYRRLARIYHPDVNKSVEAGEKFKEITEAYEILCNKNERARYDTFRGFNKPKPKTEFKKKPQSPPPSPPPSSKNQDNKKEPKKDFTGVFNDIMDGIFVGEKKQKTPSPKNGSDIDTKVFVTLCESINGTTRTINILHSELCPHCSGRKFVNGAKCNICKGTGEQSIHKKINVKIPSQVKNGTKIRIANEGNKGIFGGKNGDLYLSVYIENQTGFKIEDNNVEFHLPISITEAVLGANIEIPTPSGRVSMKIPPATSSGQKFRLSSQGICDKKAGTKGDMIVTVRIEIPKNLTKEELELFEKLKIIDNRDIRKDLFQNNVQ